MFRSPISPARACTSAASSARNPTSATESGAAVEIFFPGIRIPKHQSKRKNATTASAMRRPLRHKRRNIPMLPLLRSSDLRPEAQGADAEKQHGHDGHDRKCGPVFEKAGATQTDGA